MFKILPLRMVSKIGIKLPILLREGESIDQGIDQHMMQWSGLSRTGPLRTRGAINVSRDQSAELECASIRIQGIVRSTGPKKKIKIKIMKKEDCQVHFNPIVRWSGAIFTLK